MSKFQVQSSFQIVDQHPLFVLAGSILEGSLRRGVIVRIPVDASHILGCPIHEIEFARMVGGREQVCLLFRPDADEYALWRDLKLGNKILEVTTDGSD